MFLTKTELNNQEQQKNKRNQEQQNLSFTGGMTIVKMHRNVVASWIKHGQNVKQDEYGRQLWLMGRPVRGRYTLPSTTLQPSPSKTCTSYLQISKNISTLIKNSWFIFESQYIYYSGVMEPNEEDHELIICIGQFWLVCMYSSMIFYAIFHEEM